MKDSLSKKDKKIAVVGLGYVGLPLALEFSKKYSLNCLLNVWAGLKLSNSRVFKENQKIYDKLKMFFSATI